MADQVDEKGSRDRGFYDWEDKFSFFLSSICWWHYASNSMMLENLITPPCF